MAKPFLKWVGGKQALLPVYEPYLPKGRIPYYAEPFVGGGAMYFHLADRITEMAILADINPHLINAYRWVRDSVQSLTRQLLDKQERYWSECEDERERHYYTTRELDRAPLWHRGTIHAASRFIFLNKTCYNGLWRVNKDGQFNVPHGKYDKPRICDSAGLKDAHDALYRVLLWQMSFVTTIERILTMGRVWGIRFFVYLDPPYVPVNDTSFVDYARGGWSDIDTHMLMVGMENLDQGGHRFMCSNSLPFEDMLTEYDYDIKHVSARRNVNSDPEGRGEVIEVLVRNYD